MHAKIFLRAGCVQFVEPCNGLFFLFFYISENYLQFRKKQKHFVEENFWFNTYKKPDLLTAEFFFKLCISQRYMHNLERNQKNSVCVGVKNFANL